MFLLKFSEAHERGSVMEFLGEIIIHAQELKLSDGKYCKLPVGSCYPRSDCCFSELLQLNH